MFLPSTITLKMGDSGDFVAELQRRLAARDFMSADMVTGFYDGSTVNAVRQFQGANGLQADGVAGPETLRRLNGITDSSGSGSSNSESEQKESGIAPASARLLQLQMEEDALRQQHEMLVAAEMAPGAEHAVQKTTEKTAEADPARSAQAQQAQARLQQQAQMQPAQAQAGQQQLLQQEHVQQMTETKKQLPGVEAGRDQHVSQHKELQLERQQQAFIDRPISETFAPPVKEMPAPDIGSPNRGPELSLAPGKSTDPSGGKDTGGKNTGEGGIAIPKEKEHGRDASRELPKDIAPSIGKEPGLGSKEPQIGVPTITAPGIGAPGVGLQPGITAPGIGAPGIGTPGVGLQPGITAPGIGAPGIGAPGVGTSPVAKGWGMGVDNGIARPGLGGPEIGNGRDRVGLTPPVAPPSPGMSPEFGRIKAHMESRLPPHVIEEVRQVGVGMVGNGVQGGLTPPAVVNAPLPTPGMEQREPAKGGGMAR